MIYDRVFDLVFLIKKHCNTYINLCRKYLPTKFQENPSINAPGFGGLRLLSLPETFARSLSVQEA